MVCSLVQFWKNDKEHAVDLLHPTGGAAVSLKGRLHQGCREWSFEDNEKNPPTARRLVTQQDVANVQAKAIRASSLHRAHLLLIFVSLGAALLSVAHIKDIHHDDEMQGSPKSRLVLLGESLTLTSAYADRQRTWPSLYSAARLHKTSSGGQASIE